MRRTVSRDAVNAWTRSARKRSWPAPRSGCSTCRRTTFSSRCSGVRFQARRRRCAKGGGVARPWRSKPPASQPSERAVPAADAPGESPAGGRRWRRRAGGDSRLQRRRPGRILEGRRSSTPPCPVDACEGAVISPGRLRELAARTIHHHWPDGQAAAEQVTPRSSQ